MPIRKFPKRVTWRGPKSIAEIARKLAQRKAVAVSLPWSFHHALCVQLSDYAKVHGMLDVSGGAELLARLAEVTGLQELARLREPVRLAGATVRVHSPPPQLHLFFPTPGSQRRLHAYARHEPSWISTHLAAGPDATGVRA